MEQGFIFDLDPVLLHLGSLQLRYYGIIFASMLYIGFLIWRHQMLRAGYRLELAEKFLIWGVIAVLVGSRLGHCLFYEWDRYSQDPISMLYFWHGGLSSHGATIGLVLAMLLFSIKYKLRYLEGLDRMSMPSAVGAAAVRLGNFFNSEIVGRETDVPWAVQFPRYDRMEGLAPVWRHPSQLYEFSMGLAILGILYLVDRKTGREKRPLGLLAALFLVLYFCGRFLVEFVKEYQNQDPGGLTIGQYLSIIPFAAGLLLLAWVLKARIPTNAGAEERIAAVHKPFGGNASAETRPPKSAKAKPSKTSKKKRRR